MSCVCTHFSAECLVLINGGLGTAVVYVILLLRDLKLAVFLYTYLQFNFCSGIIYLRS